jgi:putative transposase
LARERQIHVNRWEANVTGQTEVLANDPETKHRRSVRLKAYDYSQAGAYFITICAQDRACRFGEVIENEVRLNGPGLTIQTVWDEMPAHYPGIETDSFVVMPNHIHGIIVLAAREAGDRGQPRGVAPTAMSPRRTVGTGPTGMLSQTTVGAGPRACPAPGGENAGQPSTVLTLSDAVHRFKTMTTKRYTDGVKQLGWPPYRGRLWQRNYFEHVIRDAHDLERIRQYIADNPVRWSVDAENPLALSPERELTW